MEWTYPLGVEGRRAARMLKARQRLGKYRIVRRVAEGGFASVYDAYDTIENLHVALKVPHTKNLTAEQLQDLYREVRLTAKLRHKGILSIKNAEHIGHVFSIAYPLGIESLADRLGRRLGNKTALCYAEQLLSAVSFAHKKRIIHCDIKPENVVLLSEHEVALTDFGIAKVALGTQAVSSASGTLGYMAPEHAMGKPSYRSDVFSLGLVLWRLFSGKLPEWPFEAPLVGYERLKRTYSSELIKVLERALNVEQRQRYANATAFHNAFLRVRRRALRVDRRMSSRTNGESSTWRAQREKEFQRRFGKHLKGNARCLRCHGTVGEAMKHCPWCGLGQSKYRGSSSYTHRCASCGRGTKSDWKYCVWCRATLRQDEPSRHYPDKRYVARCSSCEEKALVQFGKYCPRCRHKVDREWTIKNGPARDTKPSRGRCVACGWGVLPGFWDYCPWCSKDLRSKKGRQQLGRSG